MPLWKVHELTFLWFGPWGKFWGGWGGCIFWASSRQEFDMPPLLYGAPPLEEYFHGSGCIKPTPPNESKHAIPLQSAPCEPSNPLLHSKESKRPEPQSLQNLSRQLIALQCPSHGNWKFPKILSNNWKTSIFRQVFDKFQSPWLECWKNRWRKFWTNLGFRAFLNAVSRSEGSRALSLQSWAGPLRNWITTSTMDIGGVGLGGGNEDDETAVVEEPDA